MVAQGLADVPLVVETAQVYDTHHVAMLIAAGAGAIHRISRKNSPNWKSRALLKNPRAAMYAGLRKVIARMGISTLASYRNSHLFEVLGLDDDICREYFEDAGCYPGTKTLDLLLQDYLKMQAAAYAGSTEDLADNGLFRFRKGAERHVHPA